MLIMKRPKMAVLWVGSRTCLGSNFCRLNHLAAADVAACRLLAATHASPYVAVSTANPSLSQYLEINS